MQLQVIEQNGQRVLLTNQLAESYGTDPKIINRNFQRNSERYIEGKHFFSLTGEGLKDFKGSRQFDDSLKFSSVLYLWTEKGALLHAKSLNTDQAWAVYEKLVDSYFSKVKVLSEKEQLMASMKLSIENSEELNSLKSDVMEIKRQVSEEIVLNHGQQQSLQHAIKKRVEGIKDDYDLSKTQLYSQIHSHLRRAFAAPKYIFVKRRDFEEAISWVQSWRPLI
ncbi:ORF6N domain-containing protein [Bacillus sp. 1P06AnD]|uniref:ORF6N domain-containing protein n=1 Tax=Bacillus sp. 1P06AnD TaxID=3132208 RepID=UPI0039A12876